MLDSSSGFKLLQCEIESRRAGRRQLDEARRAVTMLRARTDDIARGEMGDAVGVGGLQSIVHLYLSENENKSKEL